MKLFYDNEVDSAYVSSPDASLNYPASNVQDTTLKAIYRGDKSIDFDISGTGSPKTISQEYTNLVTDPTDLSTANWAKTGTTVLDSGETLRGEKIWTLTSSTTAVSYITGATFVGTAAKYVVSIIARKGS